MAADWSPSSPTKRGACQALPDGSIRADRSRATKRRAAHRRSRGVNEPGGTSAENGPSGALAENGYDILSFGDQTLSGQLRYLYNGYQNSPATTYNDGGGTMAARSVSAIVINLSSETLTLQSASIPHGKWTNNAPRSISPISSCFCRSESAGTITGTEAYLIYESPSGGTVTIGWSAGHALGRLGYTATSTARTLSVTNTTSTGDGANAPVVFIVHPKTMIEQTPFASPKTIRTNALGGCDMVLSLSEDAITQQFFNLWNNNTIRSEWNFSDPASGISFQATIDAPSIQITEASAGNAQVILTIPFVDGTFIYYDGFGQSAKQQTASMRNWSYAFYIGVASISFPPAEVDRYVPSTLASTQSQIRAVVTQAPIPESAFSIQKLFLDFENANIASFDPAQTATPGLSGGALLQFQVALTDYFRTIADSANPYILGYPITVPDFEPSTSLIYPTACRLTANYNPGGSSLNYLIMANGHTFDPDKNYSIPYTLLTSGQNLSLSINYQLFYEQYLTVFAQGVSEELAQNLKSTKFCLEAVKTAESGSGTVAGEGKYSWIACIQDSGDANRFYPVPSGGGGGSFASASGAYGQGFYLHVLSYADDANTAGLAFNLQVPNSVIIESSDVSGLHSDGRSVAWTCFGSPIISTLRLQPGPNGTIQSKPVDTLASVSTQLYNGGLGPSAQTQVETWLKGVNGAFESQIDSLSSSASFKLEIPDTLLNSIVLPFPDLFIYKGVSLLNAVPLPEVIHYNEAAFLAKPLLPVGPSSENVVIFGGTYQSPS